MYFLATYVRDGDRHEKEFASYNDLLTWIEVLKEIKAKKIRKYIVDLAGRKFELK